MKAFIRNNKEVLIAVFCLWIGVTFTLTFTKLSSIDKRLDELRIINDNLDTLDELGGLRDLNWLESLNTSVKNIGLDLEFGR